MGLLQTVTPPKKPKPKKYEPLTNIEEYPIPVYQFALEIRAEEALKPEDNTPDTVVALFQSISGMSIKRDVEPLTEGGLNAYTYEFPGHVSYEHITFEGGLTSSSFFWDWMVEGQLDGRAEAKNFTLVQRRPNPDYDPNGSDEQKKIFVEIKLWNFSGAYPVSWKISDLDLDNSEKIVIESLELSFDYFELQKPTP